MLVFYMPHLSIEITEKLNIEQVWGIEVISGCYKFNCFKKKSSVIADEKFSRLLKKYQNSQIVHKFVQN